MPLCCYIPLIYDIIQRVEKDESLFRKSGSGPMARKMIKVKVKRLRDSIKGKVGQNQRKVAKRFGISKSYVIKILKSHKLKSYKRQKAPAATENK